jgi:N-acetyl-alpha-D-glucosaminyl L-malate synthase BshA
MPAKLMMVGDGPEKEKAEVLCMELGIYDKVIFFGNSNEIDKILCMTDLFLLPSETESFGLAALEAMACGVPVISSNSGGLPEVNFDGVSGYLSDVGNVDEMAANAIKILKDDKTLNKFKANALEVAKNFDIKNILPKYEALYQRAIDDYKE